MAVASVLANTEREENLESYVFYWPIVIFIWRRKWKIRSDLYFPGSSDGKDSACNVGELGLIPGLGRSPVEGNGNPLQYSCLENPMDRGAWQATYSPWGRKESDTPEQPTVLTLSRNQSQVEV